jgi:hypothetical protein
MSKKHCKIKLISIAPYSTPSFTLGAVESVHPPFKLSLKYELVIGLD